MVPWSSIFGQTAPKGAVPPKPGKVLDFKLSCFMNFILCSPFVSSFVSSAIILLQCYDPYEKSNFHVVNCTMGPQQLIKKLSSPFSCPAIFMTLSICPRCEPWDQIAKQYRSLSLSLSLFSFFLSSSHQAALRTNHMSFTHNTKPIRKHAGSSTHCICV